MLSWSSMCGLFQRMEMGYIACVNSPSQLQLLATLFSLEKCSGV